MTMDNILKTPARYTNSGSSIVPSVIMTCGTNAILTLTLTLLTPGCGEYQILRVAQIPACGTSITSVSASAAHSHTTSESKY